MLKVTEKESLTLRPKSLLVGGSFLTWSTCPTWRLKMKWNISVTQSRSTSSKFNSAVNIVQLYTHSPNSTMNLVFLVQGENKLEWGLKFHLADDLKFQSSPKTKSFVFVFSSSSGSRLPGRVTDCQVFVRTERIFTVWTTHWQTYTMSVNGNGSAYNGQTQRRPQWKHRAKRPCFQERVERLLSGWLCHNE